MAAPKNSYGIQERKDNKNKKLLTGLLIFGLALVGVFAMGAATQKVASIYDYTPALGSPLFAIGSMPIYAPWAIFVWADFIDPAALDAATTIGQFAFAIPLFVAGAIYVATQKQSGNAKLHGSAHWATRKEIEALSYFSGKGVYVGGWYDEKKKQQYYLRHNGPEHILTFAPTRSGKGVGLILPTLLSWPGSSIVLDIKGENWALTAGWRKEQGHKVFRFAPDDASGAGACYNPLEEIRMDRLECIQDVQGMAQMMCDPEGKGMDDHWTKAAFAFFSGIILHCIITVRAYKNRPANLNDLVLMMSSEGKSTKDLLQEMMNEDHGALLQEIYPDIAPEVGIACHTFVASSAQEMDSKADNEASGVLSSALVNLALYRDPIVTMNISKSDFHLHDLMNNEDPVDLFLVLSPATIDRVKPLVRLMIDQIIRHICATMEFKDGASVASYKHRCLLLFDEFTSFGKIQIIEKAIAYIAGYGGKMYLICQDTKQLDNSYGKDNALMANCHVRIAYAPNHPETADLLSKMTGQTTVVEKKVSISGGKGGSSRSTSISETARPLLTPDECMRLPGAQKNAEGKVTAPGDMLIFTAGNSPIYGRQILYFLDPTFSKRSKIPAPGISPKFPAGITDSFYYPRHEVDGKLVYIDQNNNHASEEKPVEKPAAEAEEKTPSFLDVLEQEDKA